VIGELKCHDTKAKIHKKVRKQKQKKSRKKAREKRVKKLGKEIKIFSFLCEFSDRHFVRIITRSNRLKLYKILPKSSRKC
jgi:hypothetical protein